MDDNDCGDELHSVVLLSVQVFICVFCGVRGWWFKMWEKVEQSVDHFQEHVGVPKLEAKSLQVWPSTQFFLFPCCKKSLICLEGKSMTPRRGNILFYSVFPCNSFVSVSDPRLASSVASGTADIQGRRQVWRARRGGPRTALTTADTNLDCAFVENALFFTPILECEKSTE